jgi:hypothetical protein
VLHPFISSLVRHVLGTEWELSLDSLPLLVNLDIAARGGQALPESDSRPRSSYVFGIFFSWCSSLSLFSSLPPSSPLVMSSPVPAQVAHDSLSARKRVWPALLDLGNSDFPDDAPSDTSQDPTAAVREVRSVSNYARFGISILFTPTLSLALVGLRQGVIVN